MQSGYAGAHTTPIPRVCRVRHPKGSTIAGAGGEGRCRSINRPAALAVSPSQALRRSGRDPVPDPAPGAARGTHGRWPGSPSRPRPAKSQKAWGGTLRREPATSWLEGGGAGGAKWEVGQVHTSGLDQEHHPVSSPHVVNGARPWAGNCGSRWHDWSECLQPGRRQSCRMAVSVAGRAQRGVGRGARHSIDDSDHS